MEQQPAGLKQTGQIVTRAGKFEMHIIHRIINFLHYSKIENWGHTGACYVRDFTVRHLIVPLVGRWF